MKRTFITTGLIVIFSFIALAVFNKLTSREDKTKIYDEAKKGTFEITITNAGELLAEKSLDILGPAIGNSNQGGSRSGGGSRGGGGFDFHVTDFKIQDMVPEGTIVKKGDYIAQLDRTSYYNSLRDATTNLNTLRTNVERKILDTAVTLTNLRDDIKDQRYVVEEGAIDLAQTIYEPPAIQRKAQRNLDKAKRSLEQKTKNYELKHTRIIADINDEKMRLSDGTKLVADLQEFLSKFTIRAPASGMVTYKKDGLGVKTKVGSSVNFFDNVICTLPDLSSMISKFYVSELEVSKVNLGQKVRVTIDALPDKKFTGKVLSVANVGEQLPNSDAKMFEVQIKLDESDPALRPSMTTWNEIMVKTYDNVVYIPAECVQTGPDSISYVIKKNKTRQIVVLGESNDKNVIVEQGLKQGTSVYIIPPEDSDTFKMAGQNLIPFIK
jgi:multidrug efflux pump subunit AcrA (membrane-fusion protein)